MYCFHLAFSPGILFKIKKKKKNNNNNNDNNAAAAKLKGIKI